MGRTKKFIILACSVIVIILALQCLTRELAIRDLVQIEGGPNARRLELAAGSDRAPQAASSLSNVSTVPAEDTRRQLYASNKRRMERQAERQAVKYQLRQVYDRYINVAGLKDSQSDLLVDLLEEQDELASKWAAISSGGNPWSGFDNQGGYSEGPLSSIERDIRELLGPDKYKDFCIYRLENTVRQGLKPLELRLSYTKDPLQPYQLDALIASAWSVGAREYMVSISTGKDLPDAALAEAEKVLSPTQFLAFKNFLDENRQVYALRK